MSFLGCEIEQVALAGNISSPAYGISNYPSNQICTYQISLLGGGPVSLKFNEFKVADDDIVQVSLFSSFFNVKSYFLINFSVCNILCDSNRSSKLVIAQFDYFLPNSGITSNVY